MITTAFFDPAARSGAQHDFKAIVVGTLINRIFYVRHAFIRKCSVQDVLSKLYAIHADFPDVWMGCEVNGFQILYTTADKERDAQQILERIRQLVNAPL